MTAQEYGIEHMTTPIRSTWEVEKKEQVARKLNVDFWIYNLRKRIRVPDTRDLRCSGKS